MNVSHHRRISVASCWASSRISFLDLIESYEESYAITEEFREWITCLGDHPAELEASVLMVPKNFHHYLVEEVADTDEVLEI